MTGSSPASIDWKRFADVVGGHQSFVLTSHVRPDCDALGSELGMAGVLEALGKTVRIVNAQATPPNLEFIDPGRKILALGRDITPEQAADCDVLMVLDTSAWIQLGAMADVVRATRARKLIVDHHVSQDDLGAELFKDTSAEATGRLVVDAAEALGVRLTPALAMPLFAAVATDTGWFRFNSTSSGTYRTAAKLVEAGAVPAAIYAALYEQDSLGRMRLRGVVLERIESELQGRFGHTYIRFADFAATGAVPSDTEDLVNMVLAVRGTEFAVILVELSEGGIKVSFRSRSQLDCNQIAGQFAGGGHKAAAGATVNLPFEEARCRVLDAVRSAMKQ